jgi:hypothetical protein
MMKEYVDGYVFSEPYQIVVGDEKKDFPIGSDYKILHPITQEELLIE